MEVTTAELQQHMMMNVKKYQNLLRKRAQREREKELPEEEIQRLKQIRAQQGKERMRKYREKHSDRVFRCAQCACFANKDLKSVFERKYQLDEHSKVCDKILEEAKQLADVHLDLPYGVPVPADLEAQYAKFAQCGNSQKEYFYQCMKDKQKRGRRPKTTKKIIKPCEEEKAPRLLDGSQNGTAVPNDKKQIEPRFEVTRPQKTTVGCDNTQLIKAFYSMMQPYVNMWGANRHPYDENEKIHETTRSKKNFAEVEKQVEDSKSLGYGEVTMYAFDKVLDKMCDPNKWFEDFQMSQRYKLGFPLTSLLDIGSGYAKCVWHAYIKTGVVSTGYEILKARHDEACKIPRILRESNNPDLQKLADAADDGHIITELKDVTTMDRFTQSHIFSFNLVFDEETNKQIAQVLNRSPFKMLVWCCNPKQTTKVLGVRNLTYLGSQNLRLTGSGESHLAYFYIKTAP